MEGESEVEAIVLSVSERDVTKIAGLSRDAADPFSFNSKILLALSLKSAADITEINYLLGVLPKRDFPLQEL